MRRGACAGPQLTTQKLFGLFRRATIFVLPAVFILVALTIAIATALLAPRLLPRRVRMDVAPDAPRAFGSEMSWLAVKTDDAGHLAAVLGLEDLSVANWNSGIGAIYDLKLSDTFVFISPPVEGWTFVAGVSLPLPQRGGFVDKAAPLLTRVAREFRSVQYFATFPIIDFYAWAWFENGQPMRASAFGEAGPVWDAGRPTAAERELGLSTLELRGIVNRQGDIGGALQLHPTESHVLGIAGGWGLNPMTIEALGGRHSTGWIARAPHAWRAERVRSAA